MNNNTNHIFMPEDHMDELYTSKNPLVKFVHCQRLEAIAGAMPKKEGLKVLDAGCGEGHLLEELHKRNPSNHYYGVDATEVAIQKARQRSPFATCDLMDLSALTFEDNFFDVITITEVLEHIYDYQSVINELKRVLTRNGILIITFPNETNWTISRFLLGRKPVKVPDHVNAFLPQAMKKAVSEELVLQRNLPFSLPFFASLGALMKFKKS